MTIIINYMVTNKSVCKIYHSIMYINFLSSKFIDAVFATVFGTVFSEFALPVTLIISSHTINESATILFKYPLSHKYKC